MISRNTNARSSPLMEGNKPLFPISVHQCSLVFRALGRRLRNSPTPHVQADENDEPDGEKQHDAAEGEFPHVHAQACRFLASRSFGIAHFAPFAVGREGSLTFGRAPIGMAPPKSRQAFAAPTCLASQIDRSTEKREQRAEERDNREHFLEADLDRCGFHADQGQLHKPHRVARPVADGDLPFASL